jgi:hypothetical protein
MRIAILFISLLFFMQATFATNLQPQPAGTMVSTATLAHPPHRTRLPAERKGVGAFLASFIFGPVGYLGARLFSHDEVSIYRAKQGLGLWMGVVLFCGIIWVCVALKIQPDNIPFPMIDLTD